MACRPTVTVQSQIRGASTVLRMISQNLAGEWKTVLSSNRSPTCT